MRVAFYGADPTQATTYVCTRCGDFSQTSQEGDDGGRGGDMRTTVDRDGSLTGSATVRQRRSGTTRRVSAARCSTGTDPPSGKGLEFSQLFEELGGRPHVFVEPRPGPATQCGADHRDVPLRGFPRCSCSKVGWRGTVEQVFVYDPESVDVSKISKQNRILSTLRSTLPYPQTVEELVESLEIALGLRRRT